MAQKYASSRTEDFEIFGKTGMTAINRGQVYNQNAKFLISITDWKSSHDKLTEQDRGRLGFSMQLIIIAVGRWSLEGR